MNKDKIVGELKKQFSGANVVFNDPQHPTEIICEVEPASQHPDYSVAIAVIDQSQPHYHKNTTEVYQVITGKLILTVDDIKIELVKGNQYTIKPKQVHSAKGQETWVKITSYPGWIAEDHVLCKKNSE